MMMSKFSVHLFLKIIIIGVIVTIFYVWNINQKHIYFSRALYQHEILENIQYTKVNDSIYFCHGLVGLDMGAYGGQNLALYIVDSPSQLKVAHYYPIGIMDPGCDYKFRIYKNEVLVSIYLKLDTSDDSIREIYKLDDIIPRRKNYELLIDTVQIKLKSK